MRVLHSSRMNVGDVAGPPETKDYRPSLWGVPSFLGQFGDDNIFHQGLIPRMLLDEVVALGTHMIGTPVIRHEGQYRVVAQDERIRAFVDATYRRFWKRSIRSALTLISYGYFGGEALYEFDHNEVLRFTGVKPLAQADLMACRDKTTGMFGGFRVNSGSTRITLATSNGKKPAKGFWCYYGSEFNNFYGSSRYVSACDPWREKNGTDGAKQIRRMWYYKNAYTGLIVQHPEKNVLVGNRYIPARDMARRIAEVLKTGGVAAIPSTRNPKTGQPEWVVDQPKMNGSGEGLLDYLRHLDEGIFRGLKIPDDVIAGGGGSFSGRKVSEDAFYTMEEDLLHSIVVPFDEDIVRPLVAFNFGAADTYEVVWQPMLPARQQLDAQQQNGAAALRQGGGNPAAGPTPIADAMAQAGGPGNSPEQVGLSLNEDVRLAVGDNKDPFSIEQTPEGKHVAYDQRGEAAGEFDTRQEALNAVGFHLAKQLKRQVKGKQYQHTGSMKQGDKELHYFTDQNGDLHAIKHGEETPSKVADKGTPEHQQIIEGLNQAKAGGVNPQTAPPATQPPAPAAPAPTPPPEPAAPVVGAKPAAPKKASKKPAKKASPAAAAPTEPAPAEPAPQPPAAPPAPATGEGLNPQNPAHRADVEKAVKENDPEAAAQAEAEIKVSGKLSPETKAKLDAALAAANAAKAGRKRTPTEVGQGGEEGTTAKGGKPTTPRKPKNRLPEELVPPEIQGPAAQQVLFNPEPSQIEGRAIEEEAANQARRDELRRHLETRAGKRVEPIPGSSGKVSQSELPGIAEVPPTPEQVRMREELLNQKPHSDEVETEDLNREQEAVAEEEQKARQRAGEPVDPGAPTTTKEQKEAATWRLREPLKKLVGKYMDGTYDSSMDAGKLGIRTPEGMVLHDLAEVLAGTKKAAVFPANFDDHDSKAVHEMIAQAKDNGKSAEVVRVFKPDPEKPDSRKDDILVGTYIHVGDKASLDELHKLQQEYGQSNLSTGKWLREIGRIRGEKDELVDAQLKNMGIKEPRPLRDQGGFSEDKPADLTLPNGFTYVSEAGDAGHIVKGPDGTVYLTEDNGKTFTTNEEVTKAAEQLVGAKTSGGAKVGAGKPTPTKGATYSTPPGAAGNVKKLHDDAAKQLTPEQQDAAKKAGQKANKTLKQYADELGLKPWMLLVAMLAAPFVLRSISRGRGMGAMLMLGLAGLYLYHRHSNQPEQRKEREDWSAPGEEDGKIPDIDRAKLHKAAQAVTGTMMKDLDPEGLHKNPLEETPTAADLGDELSDKEKKELLRDAANIKSMSDHELFSYLNVFGNAPQAGWSAKLHKAHADAQREYASRNKGQKPPFDVGIPAGENPDFVNPTPLTANDQPKTGPSVPPSAGTPSGQSQPTPQLPKPNKAGQYPENENFNVNQRGPKVVTPPAPPTPQGPTPGGDEEKFAHDLTDGGKKKGVAKLYGMVHGAFKDDKARAQVMDGLRLAGAHFPGFDEHAARIQGVEATDDILKSLHNDYLKKYGDTPEVRDVMEKLRSYGRVPAGLMNAQTRKMYLTTDDWKIANHEAKTRGPLFLHEFAHHVDSGDREPNEAGSNRLSSKPEWIDAWQKELVGSGTASTRPAANLSGGSDLYWAYARSSPREGFAEICRGLWGGNTDGKTRDEHVAEIKKRFPTCYEFLAKNGIIHA